MSEDTDLPVVRRRRGLRRYALPAVYMTTIYLVVLVYPPMRVGWLIWPQWMPGALELLALFVIPIAGRLAYEWRPGPWARRLSAVSMTWLGAAFLLFCVVVPWELLNLTFMLPQVASGVALATLAGLFCLGGAINAQLLHVKRLTLPASGLTRPLRLVQLSDVHVGSREPALLARMVRRVQRLDPDALVITGDLIDFKDISETDLASLGQLDCPVWYCIGNHERYVDLEAICGRLRRLGVRVLRDAVDTSMHPLVVAGIDDADSRRRVAQGLHAIGPLPEGFRILLYHRPDGLEDAAAAGVDLMLCGHTHNGQIIPFNFLVRRVFPRIRGWHRYANTHLYVSPGSGTWGPVLRLGSRSEITEITLEPA